MPENEFDPEDVLASTGASMLVRAGTFLGGCLLGHGLGILGTYFNSFSSIFRFFSSLPSFGEMWSAVGGTLIVALFGAGFYWFLWPWLIFFLYLASQFILDENGWKKWFPWLAAGQALSSYVVIADLQKVGFGWGIVPVILGAAAIVTGWKLLEAELYKREMQRFDSIEAENRKKRRAKNQGADPRTQ